MTHLGSTLDYPHADRRRYIEDDVWREDMPLDWLRDWADRWPDKAVSDGGGAPLLAPDLLDKAHRVASALLDFGLRKGDVVALQMPNVPEMLVAYYGIQMMGAVPAMVHMPYRAGEIGPMLAHVGARAVVCFNALENYDAAGAMLGLRETVPSLETVIVAAGDAPAGSVALASLLETEPRPIEDPPVAADPAVVLFTSGTSSAPKAVVHAYYTLCASARTSAADMGFRDTDTVLCAPPFTHAFGQVCMLIFLYAGATAALMPAYSPPALAETIKATAATAVCLGPAHIFAGAKAGLWSPDVTGNLRCAFIGGAACPPEAVDTLQAALTDGAVYQVWGMTEVLMPICNRPDADIEERRTSLGQPPEGHELRFVDEDGNLLGVDEEGELQIRGPFLFRRYLDNPDADASAFTEDGFFRTGDLASMSPNGRVVMTGRAKDVINRGGIKINPVDIEQIMEKHPAVAQAAVIPVPDEVLGERACLVAVTAPGATLAFEDMTAWLDRHDVVKMRWPERLEIVEAMPMTPTRKVIKGKLAKQVLGR